MKTVCNTYLLKITKISSNWLVSIWIGADWKAVEFRMAAVRDGGFKVSVPIMVLHFIQSLMIFTVFLDKLGRSEIVVDILILIVS